MPSVSRPVVGPITPPTGFARGAPATGRGLDMTSSNGALTTPPRGSALPGPVPHPGSAGIDPLTGNWAIGATSLMAGGGTPMIRPTTGWGPAVVVIVGIGGG